MKVIVSRGYASREYFVQGGEMGWMRKNKIVSQGKQTNEL